MMPKRRYTKPDSIVEDVSATPNEPQVEESDAVELLVRTYATKYSKAENLIQPEAFFVVFSNGEVREKNYFQWMMNHCAKIRLEFFSNPISPDDLLADVLAKKKEYDSTASEEVPDTYYMVTDVDHFYKTILRSKPDYEKENIRMVVSNPCFEVWLYYSKRSDKFEGFVMPKELLKLSQEVKHFLNKQIPGGCNPKKAIFDIRENIMNARKNYDEDENGIPVLFATNMFFLAEDVLPYIVDELEQESDARRLASSRKTIKEAT